MSTRRPGSRLATPVPEAPVVPVEQATTNGQGQRNSIVLGPNDRLRGELYFEGDVRVTGTVEGNLEATGDIEIAGAGKVNGDVTAYNRLTVGSDASLVAGDVRVARLTVEDGATFSGKVSMGKPAPKAEPKAPEPKPVPQPEPVAAAPAPEPEPVAAAPITMKPPQKGKRR